VHVSDEFDLPPDADSREVGTNGDPNDQDNETKEG